VTEPGPLFDIGLLLAVGMVTGLVAARLGLPRVAGYVLAGVAFSPGLLGEALRLDVAAWSPPLTDAALGIIAYLVGGSITTGQLRRMGRLIVTTTLGEGLGAVLLVGITLSGLLWLTGAESLSLALALASVAGTTAPAATVAVMHQYHADGPLTRTLLGVVALDDALGIIVFSLALVLLTGSSLLGAGERAALEIGGALALGGVGGWLLARFGHLLREDSLRLPVVLAALLLVLGLASAVGASALLASLTLGFAARHFQRSGGERLFAPLEAMEEAVFLIFFTVAGSHFQPGVFAAHPELVAGYVIARLAGKTGGAALGARLGGAPPVISRWIGFGLAPQAGVAVGLALTLAERPGFGEAGDIVVNVILASVLVNEIIGPLAASLALRRAGEAGEAPQREE
jgi:Kef-type K+ transport system membrane component KefB